MADRLPRAAEGKRPSVALIGMMAAGKPTVGRALADRLGVPFVDTDAVIRAQTGRTVRELWREGGEAAYRNLERDAVVVALTEPGPVVLAVPGGVAVDEQMAGALAASGARVVYLRAAPEVLARRIGDRAGETDHRPLLDPDPTDALARLHDERDLWYSTRADLVVGVDELTVDQVVDRILDTPT